MEPPLNWNWGSHRPLNSRTNWNSLLDVNNALCYTTCFKNRLLYRKCFVRISIHELQDFRHERVSLVNEWVSKVLQLVNNICTKHFLWCHLFIIFYRRIKVCKSASGSGVCTCLLPTWPGFDLRFVARSGLSCLLVLYSATRSFSPGSLVCPSPQKSTFPNSNSIRCRTSVKTTFEWVELPV